MKRYDPIDYHTNGGGWSWASDSSMRECPDGEWVRLSDVERENARMKAYIAALEETAGQGQIARAQALANKVHEPRP